MDKAGIETILKDFGDTSRTIFARFEEEEGKKPFQDGKDIEIFYRGSRRLVLFPSGIVWYGDRDLTDLAEEKLIGTPEDYLTIRDDVLQIKSFLQRQLDKGRIKTDEGGRNDPDTYTASCEYPIWLYRDNDNKQFRQKFEQAVVELLDEEFSHKFKPLDVEAGKRAIMAHVREYRNGNLDAFLEKDGFNVKPDHIRLAPGNQPPETLEEMVFARDFFYAVEGETVKLDWQGYVRYKNLPLSIKQRVAEFLITKRATHLESKKNWTPQYNRLLGLLEIVGCLGTPSNGFSKAYSLLREKAESGFMADAPDLRYEPEVSEGGDYGAIGENMYNKLLNALSAVQVDNELEGFWLKTIKDISKESAAHAALSSFLNNFTDEKDRYERISKVMESLYQRYQKLGDEPFSKGMYIQSIGRIGRFNFKYTEKGGEWNPNLVRNSSIDERGILYLLDVNKKEGDSRYGFTVVSIDRHNITIGTGSYDISTKALTITDATLMDKARELLGEIKKANFMKGFP